MDDLGGIDPIGLDRRRLEFAELAEVGDEPRQPARLVVDARQRLVAVDVARVRAGVGDPRADGLHRVLELVVEAGHEPHPSGTRVVVALAQPLLIPPRRAGPSPALGEHEAGRDEPDDRGHEWGRRLDVPAAVALTPQRDGADDAGRDQRRRERRTPHRSTDTSPTKR